MHRFFKWAIRVTLFLLSLDVIVALADWGGRWEWMEKTLKAHPAIQMAVKSPLFLLACFIACVAAAYGERYLKRPQIYAEYLRLETKPRIGDVPLRLVDDVMGVVGRDTFDINVDIVAKLYIVNQSEFDVTLREFVGTAVVPRGFLRAHPRWSRFFPKRKIALTRSRDLHLYRLKTETNTNSGNIQTTYVGLDDLEDQLQQTPLERGHGYTGWLVFSAGQIDRKDSERLHVRIFLRDALDNLHPVISRKGKMTESEDTGQIVQPM